MESNWEHSFHIQLRRKCDLTIAVNIAEIEKKHQLLTGSMRVDESFFYIEFLIISS